MKWLTQSNLENLLVFFQTGNLGSLKKTATIEDVHQLLGKPPLIDILKSPDPDYPGEDFLTMYYNSLTVFFIGKKIEQIVISIFDVPTILPKGLNITWNSKGWEIRKSQIKAFLQMQKIDFKILLPMHEEPLERYWIVNSQVFVDFRTEGELDPKIEYLTYSQAHITELYKRTGYKLITPS